MTNPWLKDSPSMSIWLSRANRIAATMRGQAIAEAKRQISAVVTKATNDNLKVLLDVTAPPSPKAKPKRRR